MYGKCETPSPSTPTVTEIKHNDQMMRLRETDRQTDTDREAELRQIGERDSLRETDRWTVKQQERGGEREKRERERIYTKIRNRSEMMPSPRAALQSV